MSTSFIYHSMGLVGYQYLKTEYTHGKIFIFVQKHTHKLRCPNCDSTKLIFRGSKTRYFKSLPIGKKPIILAVKIQRIKCKECHCLKQEKLNFKNEEDIIKICEYYDSLLKVD